MVKVYEAPKPALNSPGPENRILIVGRTGSGKSVAGIYHLSRANFDEMPWIIIDSKREAHFQKIQGLVEIDVEGPVPSRPGLYVLRPTHGQKKEIEQFLWRVHEKSNVGLFVDEGYMIAPSKPQNAAMRTILTQGRTLRLPVIVLSQRPTWIDPFTISEASFFQVFDLTYDKDRKTIQEFIPRGQVDLMADFGEYRSVYHDVGAKKTAIVKPVRPVEESVELIDKRLDKLNRTTNTVKLRVI